MKVKHNDEETLRCVRHPKRKAESWSGHVIVEGTNKKVLAGWCKNCSSKFGFCGWIEK